MKRKTFEKSPCSIARSLDVIGDWWTPLLVRECLYGLHRFDDFQRWLGIGKNILARRLAQLVAQGVLEKRRYQENPIRHSYHLTEKGVDAARILLAIMPFGEKWSFERGREPIQLFDRKTGRRVRPVVVDRDSGQEIDPCALFPGPGPSFPASEPLRRERFPEFFERHEATGRA